MDITRFTESKTGELVPITTPVEETAFIPDPLPPKNWQFPTRLWPLLSEAKAEVARLDGIGRSLPNPELLLRPLQSREALRSSSLEGTYATPEELLLFELQPKEPQSEKDPINSRLEVSNYSRSLRQGMSLLEELPFCLRLIKELHKTLLSGVRGRDKSPGEFRKTQNHIGSDFRFVPPPPEALAECLDSFEKRMNAQDVSFDPLVRSYLLHYQFETIHPFNDGNGRVGRALLSLMIYKWCELSMPWLYMSAYFERYKDEYVNNLFAVSATGNWDTWMEFCLRGTVQQAKDAVVRCEGLKLLRDQFHSQIDNAGPRAHQIIEGLFTYPILAIPEIATRFGVTYPTAKSDIEKLVDLNILKVLPEGRPKIFYCPGIFGIAYSELE